MPICLLLVCCCSKIKHPSDNYISITLLGLKIFFPFPAYLLGDVPRVNGQLAVSRAFGDKSLKSHLRSDPDVRDMTIDINAELLILASDGLWKVIF